MRREAWLDRLSFMSTKHNELNACGSGTTQRQAEQALTKPAKLIPYTSFTRAPYTLISFSAYTSLTRNVVEPQPESITVIFRARTKRYRMTAHLPSAPLTHLHLRLVGTHMEQPTCVQLRKRLPICLNFFFFLFLFLSPFLSNFPEV